MQIDTNWYWNQQQKQHVITVPTRTIVHPQLEVNPITDFHYTSLNFFQTQFCLDDQFR